MLAYTYIEKGKFALVEKPKPALLEPTDAIVRVTMGSILKGRDAETLYADYIEGKRGYMDITLEIRNRSY